MLMISDFQNIPPPVPLSPPPFRPSNSADLDYTDNHAL